MGPERTRVRPAVRLAGVAVTFTLNRGFSTSAPLTFESRAGLSLWEAQQHTWMASAHLMPDGPPVVTKPHGAQCPQEEERVEGTNLPRLKASLS